MKRQHDARRHLRRLTLSAMLMALSVVLLYLGALIDVLSLTAVALASLLMLFAVRELPLGFRLSIYFGTVILALLLLPTAEGGILYAMLGGLYPMLKFPMEHLHRPFPFLLKLLYCNAVLALSELCSVLLFGLPASTWHLLACLFLLANPAFFLYDRVLDRLLILYTVRLRPHLYRFF